MAEIQCEAIKEALRRYEQMRASGGGTSDQVQSVVEPLILHYWPTVADYLREQDEKLATPNVQPAPSLPHNVYDCHGLLVASFHNPSDAHAFVHACSFRKFYVK